MAETILAKLAVEVTAKATQFGAVLGQQEKALTKFSSSVSSAGNLIKSSLAGISIGLLGREIIDVTAEFQKFQAVLVNTLGSRSAANIALRDIEEFAKRTPFSVEQLTSSFVKLANQGFSPTTEELRKLGDLASSTGKGFDQLAEAIIDAQTGEFERLKEFGIRAQKQGDQVKFTFKGVQTQVKFTSESIREYILSLGDAEGVSGAMAAISETLGGQISNLGDTWTQFLKVIGDGNKGALSGAVSVLSAIVQKATDFIKTQSQVNEELKTTAQSDIVQNLKELEKITGDVESASVKLISGLELEKEGLVDLSRTLSVNKEEELEQIEALNRKALVIEAQIQAIKDYTKAQIDKNKADEEAKKKLEVQLGLIPQIEKALKGLEDQKKKSFSTEEISAFNKQISDLRDELALLNAMEPLSNFGKDVLNKDKPGFEPPEVAPTPQSRAETFAPNVTQADTNTNIDEQLDALARIDQAETELDSNRENRRKQQVARQDELIAQQQRQTEAAIEYGEIIGTALGQALSGQQTFSQAMKKLTADLLKTFVARAIGGVIANSFGSAPPPVAAGIAAAGIALVGALFSKIGVSTGGAGGSGSSVPRGNNVSRVDSGKISSREEIQFNGTFRIDGNSLVAVVANTNNKNGRIGS